MHDETPTGMGDAIEQESSSQSVSPPWKKLRLENRELKCKLEQLEKIVSAKIFDTAHVKALVEPFSGNGTLAVHQWFEKLESVFRVLKLNEQHQLIAASDLLTETAAVFRKIIPITGYDDFKAKLLEEFGNRKISHEAIVEELRAHPLSGKCLLQFVMEIVQMAQCYEIPEVDLVDIIIDGFEDDSCALLMLYGVQTIDELKKMLPRYEKRREQEQKKKTSAQKRYY